MTDTSALRDLLDAFPVHYGDEVYEGYVKLKLAHARGFSLILPDFLTIDLHGWRWFQPKFFSGCLLQFLDDSASAMFGVEPQDGVKLQIGITRDRLVRSYPDGSFLYRCRVAGPPSLLSHATGTCVIGANHCITLDLFHQTSADAFAAIHKSCHFRGSRWNIQGSKRLKNVEYVYFTSLQVVRSEEDLRRIAMASDGTLHLLPTNGVPPRDVVEVRVYRESTLNRTHTINVRVPAEAIAPQHIWRHDANDQPTYYEICQPEIFRVGLQPGTVLPFSAGALDPSNATLTRFDYVVLGHATTPAGLVAPFDEEDTRELFKIERCEAEGDLFAYWQRHANSDQYSDRSVARQEFEP